MSSFALIAASFIPVLGCDRHNDDDVAWLPGIVANQVGLELLTLLLDQWMFILLPSRSSLLAEQQPVGR